MKLFGPWLFFGGRFLTTYSTSLFVHTVDSSLNICCMNAWMIKIMSSVLAYFIMNLRIVGLLEKSLNEEFRYLRLYLLFELWLTLLTLGKGFSDTVYYNSKKEGIFYLISNFPFLLTSYPLTLWIFYHFP